MTNQSNSEMRYPKKFDNQDLDYRNLGYAINSTTFVNCTINECFFQWIVKCKFENCIIKNLDMIKGNIIECEFKNCQILNLNLANGDSCFNTFTNCRFINNNFRFSAIYDCTFKDCQVQMDNLDMFEPIEPDNVKLWHQGEWLTVTDWQEFLRLQTPN